VSAIQNLKTSFITYPLLIHVGCFKSFVLETKRFKFVVGTILSQLGKDNVLHHVNFHFHKFSLVEINYEIHGKNLQ
jgi:hypothetical protein